MSRIGLGHLYYYLMSYDSILYYTSHFHLLVVELSIKNVFVTVPHIHYQTTRLVLNCTLACFLPVPIFLQPFFIELVSPQRTCSKNIPYIYIYIHIHLELVHACSSAI